MTKIHATAVVDPSAQLGEDVEIGPFCVVGGDVQLGDRVKLRSHVSVDGHTVLGQGCDVHPFAALGGAPQHLGYKGEPTRLEIGAGTVIRESVTMNRGTANGDAVTRIGKNGFFMAYSHVAHDCIVGDGVVFANSATLAGHCHVGDGVIIGGLSAVHQHCRIGTGAIVGGVSGVAKDVIPFGSVLGARAELGGLNIIGLKRRGYDRQAIHDVRSAYRMIFSGSGTLQDRAHLAEEAFKGSELVQLIVDFLKSGSGRAFCTPRDLE
ncbi:MAG: acyl-ACP--UDP-N-acetylglucosamine O-acyltransferase [Rhodobiaceae bacterium]|nr:acyl-ACP--UDP-N-acetylglucosamine O-acyltransferase [Rhodobiaceae bacterium]MCC0052727.1 acyl-ACP--UDP-N-acetylglucosamine O-acyltransferase [Rhodobiaceae bacterium]